MKKIEVFTFRMIDKALEDSQLPVLNDPQAPSGKPKLANLISDIALPP